MIHKLSLTSIPNKRGRVIKVFSSLIIIQFYSCLLSGNNENDRERILTFLRIWFRNFSPLDDDPFFLFQNFCNEQIMKKKLFKMIETRSKIVEEKKKSYLFSGKKKWTTQSSSSVLVSLSLSRSFAIWIHSFGCIK